MREHGKGCPNAATEVPQAFPVLRRWAGSASPVLRVLAARSLPGAPFDPLPALGALTRDQSDLVSAEAADSLVRIGTEEARRTLTTSITELAESQPRLPSRAVENAVVVVGALAVFALLAELDIGTAAAGAVCLALMARWVIRLLVLIDGGKGRLATARLALQRLEAQVAGRAITPSSPEGASEPVASVHQFAFNSTDPRLTLARRDRQLAALQVAEESGTFAPESIVELLGSSHAAVVRRAAKLLARNGGDELAPVLHVAYELWSPVPGACTRRKLPRWSSMLSLGAHTGMMSFWGWMCIATLAQFLLQALPVLPEPLILPCGVLSVGLPLHSIRMNILLSREAALTALATLEALDAITARHSVTSPVVIHDEVRSILADPVRVSGEDRRTARLLLAGSGATLKERPLPVPGGEGQPLLGPLPGAGAAGPGQESGNPGLGQQQ